MVAIIDKCEQCESPALTQQCDGIQSCDECGHEQEEPDAEACIR